VLACNVGRPNHSAGFEQDHAPLQRGHVQTVPFMVIVGFQAFWLGSFAAGVAMSGGARKFHLI
jgi:multisubunit Na+/H+ antiporter MnhB subunit